LSQVCVRLLWKAQTSQLSGIEPVFIFRAQKRQLNFRTMKIFLLLFVIVGLNPTAAFGQTFDAAHGVVSGISQPLFGWDHLLVMLAVGFWAAQKFGAARWQIPAAFVGAMLVGGVAGASGLTIPGVEFVVMLSVPVIGWILIERVGLTNAGSAML